MHKKLIMACMAIAVLAAFAASVASASPVLTSNGSTVPIGTSVEYKNTGNILLSGGFNLECNTAVFKGTVAANTGSTIASEVAVGSASFSGTGSGGDCTSALGDLKWTVKSKLCLHASNASDNVQITGCGSSITLILDVTGAGISCAYSTASATATYKTNAAATITLQSQPISREAGQNIFCPSSGSLTMDFDLYTTDGTLLTIS